jgi:hypothetical protein
MCELMSDGEALSKLGTMGVDEDDALGLVAIGDQATFVARGLQGPDIEDIELTAEDLNRDRDGEIRLVLEDFHDQSIR